MPRFAFWLLSIGLVLSAGVPNARAQAPGFQVIASSQGYQFQVPSDWQQIEVAFEARLEGITVSIDKTMASPDRKQTVLVEIETVSGIDVPSSSLPTLLGDFFRGLEGSNLSSGGSAFRQFVGPEPAVISGADAAATGAAIAANGQGVAHVYSARLALRGQTLFVFASVSTEDFYTSDPSFAPIMDSFQLTAPTQSP